MKILKRRNMELQKIQKQKMSPQAEQFFHLTDTIEVFL